MDGWIEVFRAGKHVDGSDDEREWGTADLDWIVYMAINGLRGESNG